jgi:hypothetical protein
MNMHQSFADSNEHELLYFWAIGDMHYFCVL